MLGISGFFLCAFAKSLRNSSYPQRKAAEFGLMREVQMFEYDQDIVHALLEENEQFQELYEYHGKLKMRIRDIEAGIHPLDSLSLGMLKKEKLLAKDRMATIIARYHCGNSPVD